MMSQETYEHLLGTGERGKYARQRKPRDGETVRLVLLATVTWHGESPEWPAGAALTVLCAGTSAQLTKRATSLVEIDFSRPERAASAVSTAFEQGAPLELERDDINGEAHVQAVFRVTARGDHYETATETISATEPTQSQLERLTKEMTELLNTR